MYGIVGYVGPRNATEIILGSLKSPAPQLHAPSGKTRVLEAFVRNQPRSGTVGVGHTRWSSPGRSSDDGDPHGDCSGSLVVVHTGAIEDVLSLRERLAGSGHRFRSETEAEVIAHLVESHLHPGTDLLGAIRAALQQLRGSYAVAILPTGEPDRLFAARRGRAELVLGLGEGEGYLASDVAAILPYMRDMVVLESSEVAVLTQRRIEVSTLDGAAVERTPARIDGPLAVAQKGRHPHVVLEEIHEQPSAISETVLSHLGEDTPRAILDGARLTPDQIGGLRRVVLTGCGTSFHAALIGRLMIERLAGLPAEVDVSSEFRYRDLVLGPDTLVMALSQSGETADTLGAVRAARGWGAPVLGITNIADSFLAREATGVFATRAGQEIGVASTKTFAAAVAACYLVALALGRQRGYLSDVDSWKLIDALLEMPSIMDTALSLSDTTREVARAYSACPSFLYLGRGLQYPVALEGAHKLKELSYLHAEGYPAGEMKHGPITLVDRDLPVVVLVPRDASYHRMIAAAEEVRAREGRVIAIGHQQDTELARWADHVIAVPSSIDLLAPLVTVLPLQLLAYHIAVLRGCDVDQPRNLAKSVTEE